MRVFKFGGASIKDAVAIKNVASIIKKEREEGLVIVVSAAGKTTNGLEQVLELYFHNPSDWKNGLAVLQEEHVKVLKKLFDNTDHLIYQKIRALFIELQLVLERNKSPNYDFLYDQVISFGELFSTTLLEAYLKEIGIRVNFLDVRKLIKTSADYREGQIVWEATQQHIKTAITANDCYITQGFIGSDSNNFTTTLGREGSDYTAAIFAYCLQATSVTIWKDVPGVLNADPRIFGDTVLLEQVAYEEAIELAFYGASVIHPKTLQPLQGKEIPLHVKSFLTPDNKGTVVTKGALIVPDVPCFIVKNNQTLLSLSALNFSFMDVEHLSELFELFASFQIKVAMMQNSAISFSVCIYDKYNKLPELLVVLKIKYKVLFVENVRLFTIRHYTPKSIKLLEKDKEILLTQFTPLTYQIVVR